MKVFQIVAVKDELTGSFLEPTFIATREEAIRLFKYQINNIPLWKDNSSDYSLYYLGSFDQETGVISANMEKITSGHAMLGKETKLDDIHNVPETTEKKHTFWK